MLINYAGNLSSASERGTCALVYFGRAGSIDRHKTD